MVETFGDDPAAAASAQVFVMETALRRHAQTLDDIRLRALSVMLLSWESPAGHRFRTYLAERCAELSRAVDLLGSAAEELAGYRRFLTEAELLDRLAGA
ncbi:hypothetical protein E8P82_01655 [Arthrobacter echini]|uniref:Uncharacterized protein n=1 Tax=Arthrobacter echini TaxID=1529066 RepID=A0A4S5EAL0_9MICC|nr:hypothetical protein [Arthrobacter echini]THJ68633.1 hypothetical protein E8P82_01655 [Arthrobacter echini]